MASTLADVRVVVIAPSYEAPVTVSRIQNEFPRLVIDRDVDELWRAYQASNHDQLIFDRCGRVAHVLSHPRSDMTSYRDTLDAIDSARDHAPCGPCQHDVGSRADADATVGLRKSAKFYQRQQSVNADPRQNQLHQDPRTSQTTSSTTPKPTYSTHTGYGPDEEYDDDYLGIVMTTPSVQTQIPSPTTFDPLWPTPAPGQFFQSDPRNPRRLPETKFTKLGEQASENNIPCSAYTDDICFQQQEKLGRGRLSKCCKKGIYLTDVCVPGKCSNHTVQLCCFQKFLQARYACCEDDEQSLGPASTTDFSMCCFTHFVDEFQDECCSQETAALYWRSVHEVCYPNTKVDYSGIKMEVRFAEGVRVVDMNENRIWDYECRNGGNRTQYAYLPP
ncbi:unnamed protein product [Cylicocyclus nassatus]|uniref:Selenoprotein P N-terminal domain-containing protein n=1 Tax=Cylicocyclus nassatus TaxID=53992 RepID=A0AA36MCH4_CYLNA|nr:unnamed protein product [Cylicocyclus nassatus]